MRVLGGYDASQGIIELLIGRHAWTGVSAAPVPLEVQLTVPASMLDAVAKVQWIPDSNSNGEPESSLPQASTVTLAVNGSQLSFTLPSFANNDVYVVILATNPLTDPCLRPSTIADAGVPDTMAGSPIDAFIDAPLPDASLPADVRPVIDAETPDTPIASADVSLPDDNCG